MQIELERRHGERLAAEGELRGGDRSIESKVSHRETLPHAERIRRSKARQIAAHNWRRTRVIGW